MDDLLFPRRFTEASRPGAHLRIVVAGELSAGDEIRVIDRPELDLTIGDVFRIYTRDRHEAQRLAENPKLSDSWRAWAQHLLTQGANTNER